MAKRTSRRRRNPASKAGNAEGDLFGLVSIVIVAYAAYWVWQNGAELGSKITGGTPIATGSTNNFGVTDPSSW